MDLKEITLKVEGMTCDHCVRRVTKGLTQIDGISEVEVSLEDKQAKFKYDPSLVAMNDVIAKINDLGYEASL